MKLWNYVKDEIVSVVFSAYEKHDVVSSKNLENDGFLSSLSVVTILSIMEDANPEANYVSFASAEDFLSIKSIESLYYKGSR